MELANTVMNKSDLTIDQLKNTVFGNGNNNNSALRNHCIKQATEAKEALLAEMMQLTKAQEHTKSTTVVTLVVTGDTRVTSLNA